MYRINYYFYGQEINMYKDLADNIGEKYFSSVHGECLFVGFKVHKHQLIVILENKNNKTIQLSYDNFKNQFVKIEG